MNIVLINHYAGSPQHGMEYRPYYMAKEWIRLGHSAQIIAGSWSHVRNVIPQMKSAYEKQCIDGINYLWLWTPKYEGNGPRRVLNILVFMAQLYRILSHQETVLKPDIVIASSTHPLDIYPAARFARASGARLIYEVHDLWPLSPIELGGMSRWNPFIMLLQNAEDYAYRKSDSVVSMLPAAKPYMESRGMASEKFSHIPNGVNVDEWQVSDTELPEDLLAIVADVAARDELLVGYAGAHGLANALGSLIEAAEILRGDPVTFILVGSGSEKPHLQDLAKQNGLEKVIFLSPISRSLIPGFLRKLDIAFISLKNQPLFRYGVSPNKLMDYMMAERPVIYSVEAGNDPVAESGCGISIPPENPREIADAVRSLIAMSPEQRALMGKRGKQFILDNHDYRVLAQHFVDVMN